MQRTVGGTFQPSNNGEIGSDAGEGVSYLSRGSSQGKSLSPIDSEEKRAISALTRLHCRTKLHSTEADNVPTSQRKAQRCERAGEVLGGRHPTAKTPLTIRRKNRS
jgi:hypothetical protein